MKTKFHFFAIIWFTITSCSVIDEEAQLDPDFEIILSGESPDATITLDNKTPYAESFLWTFSEGANKDSLNQHSAVIEVDKSGDFTVRLTAKKGDQSKTISKIIQIPGKNGIREFKDVELAMDGTSNNYGRCFSTVTGKTYKDSEVNSTNGSLIDLLFINYGNTMYFFDNPKDDANDGLQIPQGQQVVVDNYPNYPEEVFTIEQFDAMIDSEALENLTISNGQNSFSNSSVPCIILFRNAAGYKGVIKAKQMNTERMTFDIKVQKYLN